MSCVFAQISWNPICLISLHQIPSGCCQQTDILPVSMCCTTPADLKALETFDTKNKLKSGCRMSGFTKRSLYGFTVGPNWFSFPAPGFEHSHIWLFRNTWVRHTCWLHWFVICCIWILAHRICNAPFLTIAILTAKHVVLWCHILSQLIETVKKKFSASATSHSKKHDSRRRKVCEFSTSVMSVMCESIHCPRKRSTSPPKLWQETPNSVEVGNQCTRYKQHYGTTTGEARHNRNCSARTFYVDLYSQITAEHPNLVFLCSPFSPLNHVLGRRAHWLCVSSL